MPPKALVLDSKDNVATALCQLEKGASASVEISSSIVNVDILTPIPLGHKFALKDIKQGEPITKYGETIGQATMKINKGEHVHVHNVEGLRGRGDRS
ncbi:UxaA family hydrolase [Chloroflexota bacterium]